MLGFLLIGALVNIMMAWALALWSPMTQSAEYEQRFPGQVWWSYFASDFNIHETPIPVDHRRGVGVDIRIVGADLYGCEFLQSGWPFRSLAYSLEYLEGGFRTRKLKDGTVVSVNVLTNWGLRVSRSEFDPRRD